MTTSLTVPSKCISTDTDLFISHTASNITRCMYKLFLLHVYLGYLTPQDIKVALDLHFEVDLRLSELLGSVVK